jgi:hypothetical protein
MKSVCICRPSVCRTDDTGEFCDTQCFFTSEGTGYCEMFGCHLNKDDRGRVIRLPGCKRAEKLYCSITNGYTDLHRCMRFTPHEEG